MASPVAKAVAQALGLTPDQGKTVVGLLVQHLHSQVSLTRAVRVPELGTFFRKGNELGFHPDSALNHAAGILSGPLEPVTFEIAQEHGRSWLKPAVIVLCAVLIGAAGYWGFTRMQTSSDLPESESLMPLDTTQTELAAQDELADPYTAAMEDSIPVGVDPPRVQLSSGVDDAAVIEELAPVRSFVLVVASLIDDPSAQATAAEYRELLAPVPVDVVKSDDGSRFRVTVGREETFGGISALRSELSGLPEGTWILELE